MKIGIAIPNHNQNKFIKETLGELKVQNKKPSEIFICSDDKPFHNKSVTCINNKELKRKVSK